MSQPSPKKVKTDVNPQVEYLRTLPSVRERCNEILALAKADKLTHFRLHLDKLPILSNKIIELIEEYPNGAESVPFHSRWRHFEPGNSHRVADMTKGWKCDELEKARRLIDLVLVSVLLDAGAGPKWKFVEPKTKKTFTRSEGLGIASFHMFVNGAFSSDPKQLHQVDAQALINLEPNAIATSFQVDDEKNPLVGCKGRTALLQRLGKCLKSNPTFFGSSDGKTFRPGFMVDYLIKKSNDENEISVHELWKVLVCGLKDLWPEGRTKIAGQNMGDVWTHSQLKDTKNAGKHISFHKLSQWLAYSLMEPLQEYGLIIADLSDMTGLPEYRNGGLLIDYGVLEPKKKSSLTEKFDPSSEVIVEWRALTVSLLDEIHQVVMGELNVNSEEFPLVKMLEAGTWKAGRLIAKEKRPDGSPPISIQSDGTVF